jgi:hypothetical protein
MELTEGYVTRLFVKACGRDLPAIVETDRMANLLIDSLEGVELKVEDVWSLIDLGNQMRRLEHDTPRGKT